MPAMERGAAVTQAEARAPQGSVGKGRCTRSIPRPDQPVGPRSGTASTVREVLIVGVRRATALPSRELQLTAPSNLFGGEGAEHV